MAGAFWCVVEDDRQGQPKKVTAELIGEARRWAGEVGGAVEAVWLTDRAAPEGLGQLAAWGAARVWLWEDAALAPYRGETWVPAVAELATRESPRAIWGAVTSRHRELMARLAALEGIETVDIDIDVDEGVVTLEGDVDSSAEASRIVRTVLDTQGTEQVVSYLRWRPEPT